MIKKQIIKCPQCKTKIDSNCDKCWFCDMRFSDMKVKFICLDCGMHFTDNYDVNGNTCNRSLCGSKNLKLIFRKGWTESELEYLWQHKNVHYVTLAKRLKRPPTAVHRKLFRLKKELKSQ